MRQNAAQGVPDLTAIARWRGLLFHRSNRNGDLRGFRTLEYVQAEHAKVIGLTAAARVKGGALERYSAARRVHAHDFGIELPDVTVSLI